MDIEIPKNAFRLSAVEPRLGEFDLGGVLYHARYFHIYEDAREKLLKSIGVPYASLVDEGIHLAVVEAHQEFRAPVRYGIPFDVLMWITTLRRSSLTLRYDFIDKEQFLLHSAWTKHVVVESGENGFRTSRLPEKLREGLEGYTAPLNDTSTI